MKKLLVVSLSAFAGAAVAVLLLGLALGVDAGATTASQNGDTNGDGQLDVSDAVHLLLHLFRGGEPPVDCADTPETLAELADCRAELAAATETAAGLSAQLEKLQAELAGCRARAGLPDTGQHVCYGYVEMQGWLALTCDSATCQGQDGAYATGCPMDGRFLDNGEGTVSDNCTGLIWQKDTADVDGDGRVTDQDWLPWCDALAYCENLSYAGYDDWRLPNVRELHSIVDYGSYGPSIDPVFGVTGTDYWSSTPFPGGADATMLLDFSVGLVRVGNEGWAPLIRAVRTAR